MSKRIWATAEQIFNQYGIPRSLLRNYREEGKVKVKTLEGTSKDGSYRCTYLYNLIDLEKVMDEEAQEYESDEMPSGHLCDEY